MGARGLEGQRKGLGWVDRTPKSSYHVQRVFFLGGGGEPRTGGVQTSEVQRVVQ